jgi:hypothetical protein
MLAYVSLATSLLLAGRVIFSTESKVQSLEKTSASHDSALSSLTMTSSESKAGHAALVERVNSLNISMENKASIESVSAVREAVESLRREQEIANRSVIQHLERIEAKMEKLA